MQVKPLLLNGSLFSLSVQNGVGPTIPIPTVEPHSVGGGSSGGSPKGVGNEWSDGAEDKRREVENARRQHLVMIPRREPRRTNTSNIVVVVVVDVLGGDSWQQRVEVEVVPALVELESRLLLVLVLVLLAGNCLHWRDVVVAVLGGVLVVDDGVVGGGGLPGGLGAPRQHLDNLLERAAVRLHKRCRVRAARFGSPEVPLRVVCWRRRNSWSQRCWRRWCRRWWRHLLVEPIAVGAAGAAVRAVMVVVVVTGLVLVPSWRWRVHR